LDSLHDAKLDGKAGSIAWAPVLNERREPASYQPTRGAGPLEDLRGPRFLDQSVTVTHDVAYLKVARLNDDSRRESWEGSAGAVVVLRRRLAGAIGRRPRSPPRANVLRHAGDRVASPALHVRLSANCGLSEPLPVRPNDYDCLPGYTDPPRADAHKTSNFFANSRARRSGIQSVSGPGVKERARPAGMSVAGINSTPENRLPRMI
jgi:hypothetical protein